MRLFLSGGLFLVAAIVGNADEKMSHKAAEELVTVLQFDKRFEKSIDTFINDFVQKYPALAEYRDALKRTYFRVFNLREVREEVIQMYMKELNEKELQDLLAYYKSPLGQKALKVAAKVSETAQKVIDSKQPVADDAFSKVLKEEIEKDK
jgi:hypothetical protein